MPFQRLSLQDLCGLLRVASLYMFYCLFAIWFAVHGPLDGSHGGLLYDISWVVCHGSLRSMLQLTTIGHGVGPEEINTTQVGYPPFALSA